MTVRLTSVVAGDGASLIDFLDTPMFDLRLAEGSRGRGIGTGTLRALADLVFTTFPHPRRLEGQTREDNAAMRHAFVRAGFVQESFYRQGWPVSIDHGPSGSTYLATVGYALLRDDWRDGTTTPLPAVEPRRPTER